MIKWAVVIGLQSIFFIEADMEIIKASVMGFCFGVKRAVEIAENVLQENIDSKNKVYSLGPLIHNPNVLKSLEQKGLTVLDSENIDCLCPGDIVIVRAHGTTPKVMETIMSKGAIIKDATCPRVKVSQRRSAEYTEKGFFVVIAGDKNHGEVTGIEGFVENAGGKAVVIDSVKEAVELELPEKSVLLSQTTFNPFLFKEISDVLIKKNPKIEVLKTICSATMERQNALLELSGKVQGVIVIGGKQSANTKRLLEKAKSFCPNCVCIEDQRELPKEFFSLDKIGITAGASTPQNVIDAVCNFLLK